MYSQEDMAKELGRILEILEKLDPTTKAYTEANQNYRELMKAFHEETAAREAELDHELKRKLDKARQALAEKEAADRVKQAKIEALVGLAKIGLTVTGTLAAIILTGSLEESTILSAKCLSWVKGIAPRV